MKNNTNQSAIQEHFIEDFIYHFIEWIRKLWIFCLIFAVIGASGLVGYTYATYTPRYSASATFTVNVDVAKSSAQQYNKATANQLAKTFPNILTSGSLNRIVCRDLGVSSIDEVITASVIEDTNLFTITVESTNEQRAHNVLSSVITNYPKVAKFIIGSTQLSLIDTSNVSTMPINFPNYTKKAVTGCIAGLMIGLLINVFFALMTSTIIRSSDISDSFNTECLGTIPECSRKKRSNDSGKEYLPNVEDSNVNYKFREGFFTLRNSVIRKCKEQGYKSIIVTSTISGEGKSVLSINLARSLALKGYNTVLVDFDLRIPSIHEYMDINTDVNSITDFISSKVDLQHCVYSTNSKNLFVAIEKNNNPDASEIIGTDKAKEFIKELSKIFEFVIIDSPPVGYLSDASIIADYADSVLYVIAQDVVSRRNIGDGLSAFDNLNAGVIGAVINRATKGRDSTGYERYSGKKYGYYKTSNHYSKKVDKIDECNKDRLESLSKNGVVFEDE